MANCCATEKGVSNRVPPNVERFINLYQSINVVGGGAARPASDFRGEYAAVDLAEHGEMNHVTIDKMLALHYALFPKFREAVSLGSPSSSTSIPIAYRVPAGLPIEVWDSGMLVRADAHTSRSVNKRAAANANAACESTGTQFRYGAPLFKKCANCFREGVQPDYLHS